VLLGRKGNGTKYETDWVVDADRKLTHIERMC
jgi:hypothetical protein